MLKLVVVLTGGIASGKTQVSNIFTDLGCAVIDADIVAREVVAKDTAVWHQLCDRFGREVLQVNGEIDRRILRELVFNDPRALTDLNAITHPHITQSIKNQINDAAKDIVIVVVPLLTSANRHAYFDRVLVVDVCPSIQHLRLQQRDQVNAQLAKKMLASQIDREQRLLLADDVIVNDGDLGDLKKSSQLMHGFYRSLVAA